MNDPAKVDLLREVADAFNRHGDGEHFACGNRGVSEWTLTGTATDGERIEVRGCDLWTFDVENRISRKDSFWKIRQS